MIHGRIITKEIDKEVKAGANELSDIILYKINHNIGIKLQEQYKNMNKLYIISVGSGGTSYITEEAKAALQDCDVVVSYTKYARELQELLKDKEMYASGMTYEMQRCEKAIEYAVSGKNTCIISNGDANVFGIATFIVELLEKQNLWDKVELICLPGVTSFLAAAAKVGAPISQDFAIISLSDRQMDINSINQKVQAALQADFIIGIYNPKSKKRIKPYENFLQALREHNEKIAIIAQNVGREDKEKITITTTTELIQHGVAHPNIAMATLIIIGNSKTQLTQNGLVFTPRS